MSKVCDSQRNDNIIYEVFSGVLALVSVVFVFLDGLYLRFCKIRIKKRVFQKEFYSIDCYITDDRIILAFEDCQNFPDRTRDKNIPVNQRTSRFQSIFVCFSFKKQNEKVFRNKRIDLHGICNNIFGFSERGYNELF